MIKNSIFRTACAFVVCASFIYPVKSQAADFQVAVKRFSVTQCSLTGSMLNIDPASGNISIDLNADFSCYPLVVSSIANNASLTVTGPTTVGGGLTGQGTVNLQLNTGLTGITPGVTCSPDGITASNVNVTSGWTTTLCNNCGATVTRSVAVQNPSSTLDGNVTFKAKCSYQDQANVNLSSIRSNIQSNVPVTVQHGTAPVVNFCSSVTELADPKGLTDAMRQGTTFVSGGTLPGNRDALNYASVFGISPDTVASGDPDNQGFGFPGVNRSTFAMTVSRNQYVSMKFRAPSNPIWNHTDGNYLFTPPPSNSALTLAVIAPCPGQFSSDTNYPINNNSCRVIGKSNLYARIESGSTNVCQLIPGNTYYFNVIQANGFNNLSSPSCGGSSCGIQIGTYGFPNP